MTGGGPCVLPAVCAALCVETSNLRARLVALEQALEDVDRAGWTDGQIGAVQSLDALHQSLADLSALFGLMADRTRAEGLACGAGSPPLDVVVQSRLRRLIDGGAPGSASFEMWD